MLGIQHITTEAEVIDLGRRHLSLKDTQEMVASGTEHKLIEFVHFKKPAYQVGEQALVVNESGLLYGLPDNELAMAMINWQGSTPLVGDVVLIEWEECDF